MLQKASISARIVLFAAIAVAASYCHADTFHLTTGGRIEGTLLNPEQAPRESYVIETTTGGRITLQADQVENVVALSPVEKQYLALLPRMPMTVEGLWAMAEWCRESGLNQERETHLQHLLTLDPEHKPARLALGYNKIDGKWIQPDEHMRSLGYVRFGGAWRLPQEIEIEEQKARVSDAENQWRRDVRNWRSQVGKRRGPEAIAQMRAIRDPLAAPALVEQLNEETHPELTVLYVDVLGRLNHGAATGALIAHALNHNDERIRDLCLDQLVRRNERGAVPVFIQALGHKENYMINRAAVALARMGDPRAIVPLMNALVTKHKQVIQSGGGQGSLTPTFSSDGGGGLGVGGKPKVIEREVQNPAVLQALTALTSVHHGYNSAAWKAWYTAENAPHGVNLRREP
jgi:hypothetical protein